MNSVLQQNNLADFYYVFLKNLNANSKLDLISKLSESLKENQSEAVISLQSLFGAYKSEESSEEIISNIRESRVFNRTIESL
jgi:hypothetical protein